MAYALQLFGGFRLTRDDGETISLPERAQALLAYLAVTPGPVPRRLLAELLVPAGDEQQVRTALRQTIYLIRKAMADREAICSGESDLALDQNLVRSDVERFRTALARDSDTARAEATEVCRGAFLDGLKAPSPAFEDWLAARRTEFLEAALDALLKLASSQAAAGQPGDALAHARQALVLDPLCEVAHRQVMRCLADMHQRSSALRHYETARRLLAEELGVAPEPETEALRQAIARSAHCRESNGETVPRPDRSWRDRRGASTAALAGAAVILLGGAALWLPERQQPQDDVPSIAVLRFDNVSGNPAQDYLERGVVREITAMLSTHPGLRVVSRGTSLAYDSEADVQLLAQELGARYLLEGSVMRRAAGIHMTAQLIDTASGDHVWARQFEEQGADLLAIQQQIAGRIYESLVGFTGAIERHEQHQAWSKSPISLEEQDYLLRGEQLYFRFTRESHAGAQAIWQEGLARFPASAALRRFLAASYRHAVEAGWSDDPERDLAQAWQLGREGARPPHRSRSEEWVSRWLMAKLAQWCRQDFALSLAEAKAAAALVPYDATSRADLAELLANAGKTGEAIDWLQTSIRRDPKGPEWYRANLAWAYYLAGRYDEAWAELQTLSRPRHLLEAAVQVRLGNPQAARAAMAAFLESRDGHSLAEEARRPLIPGLKDGWLDDLRVAGLPGRPQQTSRSPPQAAPAKTMSSSTRPDVAGPVESAHPSTGPVR